ncbi:hypothetical protein T492DRAFT_1132373, partial [Pavlovales sp. CCMP2436]
LHIPNWWSLRRLCLISKCWDLRLLCFFFFGRVYRRGHLSVEPVFCSEANRHFVFCYRILVPLYLQSCGYSCRFCVSQNLQPSSICLKIVQLLFFRLDAFGFYNGYHVRGLLDWCLNGFDFYRGFLLCYRKWLRRELWFFHVFKVCFWDMHCRNF